MLRVLGNQETSRPNQNNGYSNKQWACITRPFVFDDVKAVARDLLCPPQSRFKLIQRHRPSKEITLKLVAAFMQ